MNDISIIGYIAAIFTTFSALPQLLKIIKTRKTRDISLTMFAMMGIGISLWLTYGWLNNDMPLILANAVSIIFIITIITYKLIYK